MGYAVAVGYCNNREKAEVLCFELRGRDFTAMAVRTDLADAASVAEAYEAVKSELGAPEVLINNGGKAHIGLFADMDDAEIISLINTDLTGALLLSKRAAKEMAAAHFGRIINISSVWGEVGASCEAAYSAAKAGLIGFTKALGKELAPSGVTVNCICAGMTDTEMNSCLSEADKAAITAEIPAGRICSPDEIAALAGFLCSPEASYITAQSIRIDGGWC